ncbi:UvrABC system protein C [Algimonas arctica]|uniref:UvrABC system protein C n=1 Tax=Algimonas arctica TaxID=1479486 RepID=A0A8J3G108_9PROT|nr:excinuclease ABC subunit UvrC [Algimonas arctica]GHA82168.1 UvrABC system protein C [Algimonas arctica]
MNPHESISPAKDPTLNRRGKGEYGPDRIKHYVKRLPNKPGVYRMTDEHGTVLYVGKAKDLKKRVSAYTKYDRHPTRLRRMIRATTNMEFVVTESEVEALLLEAQLIKKLKPRYNILLRDDKSFPYILVRKTHPAAQVVKHRGARKIKGDYYGPFASAGAVNRTLDTLQRAFMLRNCSDSYYEGRSRPCLQHQIKRCSAPCTGVIGLDDYGKLVTDAEDFLKGRSDNLRQRLKADMDIASKAMNFEKAAELRDRLRALAKINNSNLGKINPQTFSDGDVIAVHTAGGQSCVQVFFFRAGQNWGNSAHFPRHDKDHGPEDVLDAFLAQFYADKPIPKEIFISHDLPSLDLIERALSERADRKIQISVPQRGEKKKLLDTAQRNAQEALGRRLAETQNQTKLLAEVCELFGMDAPPNRIEVFDNSHNQGTNAIGAFVVAGPEGFRKRDYRSFNIQDVTITNDDFGMMREVLTRRFSRLVKDDTLEWPDLVLIDGGKGQLSAVTGVLTDMGILGRITLVAIAKGPDRNAGRETFYMNGRDPFTLPPRNPAMYYLQRLRDEAHRFAIGTHRARRKKDMKSNPLDGILGVGPGRKRALLAHFGSAKAVKNAALDELSGVEGVSGKLAQQIHDYFHE